jgi:hypothetical protein
VVAHYCGSIPAMCSCLIRISPQSHVRRLHALGAPVSIREEFRTGNAIQYNRMSLTDHKGELLE